MTDEGFETMSREEADSALSMQITNTVLAHPEVLLLKPEELSKIVTRTLDESHSRRNGFVRLWSYGCKGYRYAKWGYAAVTVYQHPWIVWTTGKAIVVSVIGFL